jgi:hypothetical protein
MAIFPLVFVTLPPPGTAPPRGAHVPGSGLETSSVNPHDIKTVQVHAFHATEVDAVVPRIVDGFVKRMTAANSTEIMIDQMIAE